MFIFRHRSARLLMCKRAQFHHAIAMTQIYSQEMSEVFQFSYFDMEDTFSSFGTVAHYFFFVSLLDCLILWNSEFFVTNVPTKVYLFLMNEEKNTCTSRYQIRFGSIDRALVGQRLFVWYHATMCYLTLAQRLCYQNTFSTHTESVRKRAREREDVGLYRKFMARYSWPINSHISSTISNEKQTDNKNKTTTTIATNILTKLSNAQFMYIHVIHFYRGCLGHQKWNN